MPMEAEAITVLILGFIIVTTAVFSMVFNLLLKSNNKVYLWFLGQFFFLSWSFIKLIDLIKSDAQISAVMASEENSLALGNISLLWAASMICMALGIWGLSGKARDK